MSSHLSSVATVRLQNLIDFKIKYFSRADIDDKQRKLVSTEINYCKNPSLPVDKIY